MLTCHGKGGTQPAAASGDVDALPDGCIWFDLFDPTAEETQRVERATGLDLPGRDTIRAVEMSSRARIVGDALFLNIPYFVHAEDQPPTPLGLIVTPKHVVSIRFAESPVFAQAAQALKKAPAGAGSTSAFAELVETVVGQIADQIENVAATIGTLTTRIIGDQNHHTKALRAMLGDVTRLESRLTRARLTMTGLLRILLFVKESAPEWIGKAEMLRLKSVHKDLDVLCELDAQMTDKLQFVLDAVLGFINIDQNDVMKIFTVASVASIPPVILVGIWGMNFANMPELHWPHGYPMALGAIALSVIIPVLWFKRRGWL
jgi:magnesium transporter